MRLLYASLYKELINKKRYLASTFFTMILFCAIFLVIILGYSAIGGTSFLFGFGSNTSAVIVSYYAWTMMLSVYTSTGYVVTENKKNGTLENMMCNTPHFTSLLISESIISSIVYFVFSLVIIILLSVITQVQLHFLFLDVFAIMMIGLFSVLGLSLLVAGSAMLFRKAEGIQSILQFLLLGFLFMPDAPILRLLLPFYVANKLLTSTFVHGTRLFEFTYIELTTLAGNAALYMIIGIFVFSTCVSVAKRKGLLSYY